MCTVIYQNVSASVGEIVSQTIEINNNTANGPVLSDGDRFGSSIANIGDLNNDGISDIVVGAIYDDAGGITKGAIHVMLMNSNGSVSNTVETNDNTANGPVLSDGDRFGSSIANIGDLNNDGISEIAVGAINDDAGGINKGAIHVMFMNSNGSVSNTVETNDLTANGPVLSTFDYFGYSIANIGDLNADGISEIAVGAYYDDAGGTNRGAIHVMFMNSNGSVSNTVEINDNTANGPVLSDGDHFGYSIANIGDLNNDGISDIAVGAYYDDAGGTNRGAIHVMFMNSNGSVSNTIETNDLTANGPVLSDGVRFGSSIANTGDLNNDGISDIAVGAYYDDAGGTNRGAIHVMFMNSNGSVSNTVEINDNTANGPVLSNSDHFGSSIANIGDLNNDGVGDIAVGAIGDDAGGTYRGAIHVMLMNPIDNTPPTITNITSNATIFGALKVGDTITFTLTAGSAEIGATINGTFNSVALSWNSTDNGVTYTANYTVSEGDMDQTTPLQITNVIITDDSGNTSLPFNGTDILKTIDANSPIITSITSDATSSGILGVGDTITFTMTSDSVEVGDIINGIYNLQPLSWSATGNGTAYTTTYVITEGMLDQTAPLQITNVIITDDSGNTSLPFNGTDILKTIDANAPAFISSTLNYRTGVFTIMFDHIIDISVVNSTQLYIRETGATTGGVTLSSSELITTANDLTLLFVLTEDSHQSAIAFTTPQLDIDVAAVRDIVGNPIATSADNPILVTNIPELPTFCNIPDSVGWIITASCTLSANHVVTTNVLVQNNSVLVIPDGVTLDIDFANNNLTVESGSGVLIKSGGTIT